MLRIHVLWYGPQIGDPLDVVAVLLGLMKGVHLAPTLLKRNSWKSELDLSPWILEQDEYASIAHILGHE